MLDRVPGDRGTGCAQVGERAEVRSGSVVVGNFAEARTEVAKGGPNGAELQLYVFPQHAASMPGVRLTATPPSGPSRTVTSARSNRGDEWSYYRVALWVKGRGTWRLDVASGPDTGCFLVRF